MLKRHETSANLNADAAARYLGISLASFRELRRRFPVNGDTGPAHNPQWSASRFNGHLSSPTLDTWAGQRFLRALLTTRRSIEAQRLQVVTTVERMRRDEQRQTARALQTYLRMNPPVNVQAKAA